MRIASENVSIVQASVEDANLIAVLGAVTFYEAYVEQDEPPDLANYIVQSFNPAIIQNELENLNSTFFLVYLNDLAVGYAKLRENNKIECITEENAIELQRIYIIERVYGRGVGEILLNHCLEMAKQKGYKTLWLSVWEENSRAIRFYEKQEFKRVGKMTFPYGSTVGTNLVMKKML